MNFLTLASRLAFNRTSPPSTLLRKYFQYALTLWRKLTRFLEYLELELSNNLVENSMRPVALRSNELDPHRQPTAGPQVAAILSVVESCRRLKLSLRDYLAAVLPGLGLLSDRSYTTPTKSQAP